MTCIFCQNSSDKCAYCGLAVCDSHSFTLYESNEPVGRMCVECAVASVEPEELLEENDV